MPRPKKTDSGFSKRLKELMESQNLTIRALSKRCSIPSSTLNDWLSGVSPSDFLAVRKLAKTFGTSMSYLLTGEPEDNAHLNEFIGDREVVFEGLAELRLIRLVPHKKEKIK